MTDILAIAVTAAPLVALVAFPIALAWVLDPSAIPGRGRPATPARPLVHEPEPTRWSEELPVATPSSSAVADVPVAHMRLTRASR
jgi:hypothetical protein